MKSVGKYIFSFGLLSSVVAGASCFVNVTVKCSSLLLGSRPDYVGMPCAQSNNDHGTCSDVAKTDPSVSHSQTAEFYVPGKQGRMTVPCTVRWEDWVCNGSGPDALCVMEYEWREADANASPINPTSLGCVRYPAPGGGGDL